MAKYSQHLKKHLHSFTLIEILIVSAMIVLFSGIVLTSFGYFNQNNLLDKEASKMVDVISLAKAKTQASEVGFNCTAEEFGGYRVDLTSSSYDFKQCCRDINTKVIDSNNCGPVMQNYNLPPVISKSAGPSTIDFYPLSGGATAAIVTLKNSTTSKCSNVAVSATGIVSQSNQVGC